jgi:hypothetical protein
MPWQRTSFASEEPRVRDVRPLKCACDEEEAASMPDDSPMAGRPFHGGDEEVEGETLPGERPVSEDEKFVGPPQSAGRDDETASRAAEEGAMSSDEPGLVEPTPGIPEPVDAPSPADATEGDPPGGSAANQRGSTPDQ